MRGRLGEFWGDDAGATAVEYSLMAAAIAGLIVAVVFTFGGKVQALFQDAADKYP